MQKIKIALLLLGMSISTAIQAQQKTPFTDLLTQQNDWVDSVFHKLHRRGRIAQLFFVRAHTDKGKAYEDSIANVIVKQRIGGLVFFQGGPVRQAGLINKYQSISRTPLLIAQDGEWGLGMRLDSTISFPYQMTLGAIQDNQLIYRMGLEVARQFKRVGVNINFAPDIDINNNPKNPVIGYRSFGDNKYNVTAKGGAYMKGMQDGGLLVSLKHFPGHGDTDVDSHYDLPQLKFNRERLDSLEMYPFRELVKQGASGVMVAHMNISALDNTPNLPSTLSRPIVTGILKEQLGFKGIVYSDAMEMKGVVKFFPGGEADVRAVIAGNDVIELSENSERAMKLVRKAIRENRLTWDQVNASARKILVAKFWAGLDTFKALPVTNLVNELNTPEALNLKQQLSDAAVTVLNSDSLLKHIDYTKRTALVSLGVTDLTTFQSELARTFTNSTNFILSKIASSADMSKMLAELKKYDQIIVGVHDYRKRPGSTLDYNSPLKVFIANLARLNTITCVFANPYTVAGLPGIEQSKTLLMNYENSDETQKAAAKVIKGEIGANGRLPVSINVFYKNGDGIVVGR
ncbi:glycoside hydrolase family 3 (plasmid) [Pedobacter sp. BS3]|uniref:glycoside hydrolase family 3 protein n=1 Tax=Pedobacter sp. BS3 TaxID=2567937 RepID=UPI0011F00F1A|nr:glycoside hydrolase family 3 N-terminal domain-containing protein [Pedobacter sp. BS3]TZF86002.1 glycoside hydrolase family 3 [Pedobacter sp. BS3]